YTAYGKGIGGPGGIVGASWGDQTRFCDYDVTDYFKFDGGYILLPYKSWIFPFFEKKTISESDNHIELWDVNGIRKKIIKDDSSMPLFLDWPVHNKKDWGKVKEERFNLNSINKRWITNKENFIKKMKNRTRPLLIFDPPIGFFGSLRELIGVENLFFLFYDEPKLIHSILDHLCNLWISIAEELTAKIDFDMAIFWEDMAGKQGSLISPLTFKEFLTPRYKKIINFLKSKGIKYFLVDTDGKVDVLIPLFLEAGINAMLPFEQQAGNDLINIRKEYPNLIMFGGFDKNTLHKGKEFIDKELEKMNLLISKGGYIPFVDHDIPPNSSWENFKYYRNRLNEIIYSTKVLSKTL
ncbi:MAG: hypothetical protein FJW61_05425, partial [Actinobacteria bacterium]|nr:hypothetical protein [Actinomycetota bacterium]